MTAAQKAPRERIKRPVQLLQPPEDVQRTRRCSSTLLYCVNIEQTYITLGVNGHTAANYNKAFSHTKAYELVNMSAGLCSFRLYSL